MKWNITIIFINFTKLSQTKVKIATSIKQRGVYEKGRKCRRSMALENDKKSS